MTVDTEEHGTEGRQNSLVTMVRTRGWNVAISVASNFTHGFHLSVPVLLQSMDPTHSELVVDFSFNYDYPSMTRTPLLFIVPHLIAPSLTASSAQPFCADSV